MPVEAVSLGILHTNLVIPQEVVLIILLADILEVMVHMFNRRTLQTLMPPGTIITARRGM